MIKARIDEQKSVPLWAAIGAPLVGVPLMVALLALTASTETATTGVPGQGAATEQLEIQKADGGLDQRTECVRSRLQRG